MVLVISGYTYMYIIFFIKEVYTSMLFIIASHENLLVAISLK